MIYLLLSTVLAISSLSHAEPTRGHGITASLNDRYPDAGSILYAPWMAECCKMHKAAVQGSSSEWRGLMSCTNTSSYSQEKTVSSGGVGLVTFATRDIWNYSTYSFAVNEVYAEANGYVMKHLDESSSPHYDLYDSRWNKVKILEEALDPVDGWARHLEWLVWLDADAIVLDMDLRIEKIVASYPYANVLMSAEHAGSSTLVNSGAVIVRNTPWTRTFLHTWWTFKNRKLYSDQEQFDLLFKAQEYTGLGLASKVAILPPDAINSDPPAMTQQRPHNQVLHLMGEHQGYRVRVFRAGLQALCAKLADTDTDGAVSRVVPQLGLGRDTLLQWTLEEYGRESALLLQRYRALTLTGDNDRKASVRVSNSVHHYAHALGTDDPTAQALRKEVYMLLHQNVQGRRKHNEAHFVATGKIMEEWPEHLKCLAEAGQHLLHVGSIADRHRIAAEVQATLEEMLRVSHKEQHRAVMLMVAHMDFEVGMIYLAEQRNHDGVAMFQRGVDRHRELAAHMGEHILISPVSSLASALCTIRRFDDAKPLYMEAIRIAEAQLGRNHGSLGQHLINFGISRVQRGDYDGAVALLSRAREVLLTANGDGGGGDGGGDPLVRKCDSFLDMARRREGQLPPLEEEVKEERGDPTFATTTDNTYSNVDSSSHEKVVFRRRKGKDVQKGEEL